MASGPIGTSRQQAAHNDRLDQRREALENEDIAEQAALSYAQHNTFERIQADIEGEVDGFRIGKPDIPPPPVAPSGVPQHHLASQQQSAEGQAVAFQVFVAQSVAEAIMNPESKKRLDVAAIKLQQLDGLSSEKRADIIASAGDLTAKLQSGELTKGEFGVLLSELEGKLDKSGQNFPEESINAARADAIQNHEQKLEQLNKTSDVSPAEKLFGGIGLFFATPVLLAIETVSTLDSKVRGTDGPKLAPFTELGQRIGLFKDNGQESVVRPEGPLLAANGLTHLEMLKLLSAENPESEERKKELQEAILALQSGNPVPAEGFLGKNPEEGAGSGLLIDPTLKALSEDMLEVTREAQSSQAAAIETEAEIQRNSPV